MVAIADLIVVNALLWCAIGLSDIVLALRNVKILYLLANVSYLLASRLPGPTVSHRAVHMDNLVAHAFNVALLSGGVFWLLTQLIVVSGLTWQLFAWFISLLVIVLPAEWVTLRIIVKKIRSHGRNYVDVVIVGTRDAAHSISHSLRQDPGFGYKIHGFFDDDPAENFSLGKYLGDIETLEQYVASHKVDQIFYAKSSDDEHAFRHVVRIADEHMIKFYYVPRISRSVARGFSLTRVGSTPVLGSHSNPLDSMFNRGVKRAFDLAFSGVFLLVSPVIFIPIAIAIKVSSPGPVFFRQRRTGYRGREFVCLKFRSMRVNDNADSLQATSDDPRKTRVGDFLRRTSLDELPQFINVFMGDMSVVGPRPHMIKHTEQYSALISRFMVRHIVKPGITGWAQVTGYRGATEHLEQMEGRVEKDVWYIENWNLMLDFKIIVRTVFNAIRGEENAY